MPETVFYSWQSDLPNKTNRSLIESALTRALQSIVDDVHLQAAPRLDQDTRGVPGSPDIASTILSKIDAASAFVGDVSLVTESEADRPSPNPNVLIELGYALKALGPSRVVMVFNERFGKVEDLPFDLRLKRTLSYSLGEDSEPKEARDKLQSLLENALRLIFESSRESARARQLSGYVSNVIPELISFLMLGNQMAERDLNPWFDTAQSQFESNARTIRDLAVREEADSLGVADELRQLGGLIDEIVDHRSAMGQQNWTEYLAKTKAATDSAENLLHKILSLASVDSVSAREAVALVPEASRRISSLAREAQKELDIQGYRMWEELRDKAVEEGAKLLRLSYYDLSALGIDQVLLRKLAIQIHQLELMEQRTMSRDVIDACLNAIVRLSGELRKFAKTTT